MYPFDVTTDAAGNVYVADFGSQWVREIAAGTATIGPDGSGTLSCTWPPATSLLCNVSSAQADATGDLFVTEDGGDSGTFFPNVIAELPAGSSTATVIAGGGATAPATGVPALQASLPLINDAVPDVAGDLYFTAGNQVWELPTGSPNLKLIAGTGAAGFSGDGGAALAAEFSNPGGVGLDSAGNVYVADTGNQRVREIAASSGNIQTVAGGGAPASGNGDGGPATAAVFTRPEGIRLDGADNLLIADFTAVRVVNAATGVISTLAGTGTGGFSGDGGPAAQAALDNVFDIAYDGSGNLYLADIGNVRIRKITNGAAVAQASFSAATVQFYNQTIGAPPATETLTVTNSGTAPLNLIGIALGGANASDFGIATGGTCKAGGSVPAGGGCTLDLTFTPSVNGAESASLVFTDSALPSTQTVPASGSGVLPAISFAPASATFGAVQENTTGPAMAVVMSNAGPGDLLISNVAISGANAADFTLGANSTCMKGITVPASSNCALDVIFQPSTLAAESATLTVADNGSPATQAVALSGSGAAAAAAVLSATSLTFSAQFTGSTSAAQTTTLSNTGGVALAIGSIAASSEYAQTNSCGSSLAAGANCTISVTFTPTATGSQTGTLAITDSAANSPQSVALMGTGADLSITPGSGSSTSATVAPGSTATYTLSFAAVSGATGTFNLACSGAPTGATCMPSPASVALTGSAATNVSVSVTTTAAAGAAPWPASRPLWPLALLALPGLAWLGLGRRRFLPAVAFGTLCLLAGCGGGNASNSANSQGNTATATPAGTYTLTVTASNGTVSRSTQLTLVVN